MDEKHRFLIILCIIELFCILGIYFTFNKNYEKIENINLESKIDSLNLQVDYLKHKNDSLVSIINNRNKDLDSIEIRYEETNNIINTMSIDSQYMFFTKYLDRYYK